MRAARTATLLLALLPALSWAQQTAPAPSKETSGQAANSEEAVTSKVPLEDIRRFVAVYNAVRAAYVDPVDDKKLMQSAVRGLLLDLDPHSTYFNKEDAQAFDEQANGAYEGIGVELQQQPDNASMKVISPIDDTPAAKAGILAGDLIIAIDGKPISAIDASEPLRGPAGSKVVLTIVRAGKPKPFDVSLTRQTIRVTSVRSRLLEPGYGYIRLSTFQADTGSDFQKHLQQLQKQSGGQLKGLVLDLRSNPGGLLTAAVQVADDLLDKGNIVSTRGRISISDARFDATPGDLLKGTPVVVLVDAGSASASEVLAGALRDNKRARGRQPHLRQRLGADRAAAGQRRFGEADHRALLHAQRQVDPGHWHRAGGRTEACGAPGRRGTAGQPERLQRSDPAGPSAWRRRRHRGLPRRCGAAGRWPDQRRAGRAEEPGFGGCTLEGRSGEGGCGQGREGRCGEAGSEGRT